jgi:hypothetical protein
MGLMRYRTAVVRAVNGGSAGKMNCATGLSNEENDSIDVFHLRTLFTHGGKTNLTLTKQILTVRLNIQSNPDTLD